MLKWVTRNIASLTKKKIQYFFFHIKKKKKVHLNKNFVNLFVINHSEF